LTEIIERNRSVITGNTSLEFLYSLKSFPAFIGCTDEPIENDVLEDMVWMICKESGVIQLKYLLPEDLIYSQYHSEAVGTIWHNHHLEFSKFVQKYFNGNILEIGGSNGILAQNFFHTAENKNLNWTIVEPNPSFNGDENIKVIKAFFNENTTYENVSTIVHSHVLEHFENPNVVLNLIRKTLPQNGIQIFSIPNLYYYLKNKFSNAINYEHTYLLTEELTDYLLAKHGFQILEKCYFNNHSIFYATKKSTRIEKPKLINKYEEHKNLYVQMVKFYDDEVVRINDLIDKFNGKVYLFGAHIFSQFLIYRGLNYKNILNILDNSSVKAGKRLYGTSLIVKNPSLIRHEKNAIVILKAGQYQDEVKRQLIGLNPDIKIIE